MKGLRILVTGSGFLGRALIHKLASFRGWSVIAVSRSFIFQPPVGVVFRTVNGIESFEGWSDTLKGVKAIIHTAARVHVMKDNVVDSLAEYRCINVDATIYLARQAAAAGVKRFIFISSIKVNGEATFYGKQFLPTDEPRPRDAYGLSKMEAEQGLMELASETGLEVVIIRPPLVYGAGVKGNFASMIKLVERGFPLPLGAIHNKRSLVGIDNLVDLIIRCIDHPAAANQVFLAGDGKDLSTTELLRGVGEAMGNPARLIPVPAGLLQLGATLLGKKAMAQRLLESLQVDISKTCELLDWKPPYTVDEGLRRCFEHSN